MTSRWKYYDQREWLVDANGYREQFAMVSIEELTTAYTAKLSGGALRLWLLLLHRVSGRTHERTPDGYALGQSEISDRTGMSRASIYRAYSQLKKAGLVGGQETRGNMVCWLAIPRCKNETEPAENDSGKLESKSQNCDLDTATGPSQKGSAATGRKEPPKVSNLSQLPRINSSTKLSRGGQGSKGVSELQRGRSTSTEMIQVLHSKIAEDSEDCLARLATWRESPEQSAALMSRKKWKMRNGPDCSDLNLWGWYGSHRVRDIVPAMVEAMEWRAGNFEKF